MHVDQQQICLKIDKTYREIIEQIRKLKHKERKAAETKESVDKQQVEEVSFEKPGELLESVIADVVRKELAGRHKTRDGDGEDDQIMADENEKPKGPNTQDVRRSVDAFVDKVGLSKKRPIPRWEPGGKIEIQNENNRRTKRENQHTNRPPVDAAKHVRVAAGSEWQTRKRKRWGQRKRLHERQRERQVDNSVKRGSDTRQNKTMDTDSKNTPN